METESLAAADHKAGKSPVTSGYRGRAAKEDSGVPQAGDPPVTGRLFRENADWDQSGPNESVDPFACGMHEYFHDDGAAEPAKEVRLKTKNVEVRQANTEEKDFKWIEEPGRGSGREAVRRSCDPEPGDGR